MLIKTNLSRVTKYHDNVNFEPIERQVLEFIKSTGIFNKVEYKVSKDNKLFILNDQGRLYLSYNCYGLTITYDGDGYGFTTDRDTSFFGIKYKIEDFKHQSGKDEFTPYLKRIMEIMTANLGANEIVRKFPINDEIQANLNSELNKYFNNKSIRAEYSLFPINLMPKLSNEYRPGVWSWLNFRLVGTNQDDGSNRERFVSVELYNDGKVQNPRIEEFIKGFQCNNFECKPTIKEMQEKLANIAELEEKIMNFNGLEIPILKDFLAVQSEGLEYRRNLKFIK